MAPPTASLSIASFAFTVYPVLDPARARAFYEGVLGLQSTAVWEEGGNFWVEYDLAGHTLAIAKGPPEWTPTRQGPSLALEVEDFPAVIAGLRSAGVTFLLEPFDSPVCRMAVILDSEGNSLIVHRRGRATVTPSMTPAT
jgi:predicted enzyme related to lactoylglutathione lyase